jgi:hypothetical protein
VGTYLKNRNYGNICQFRQFGIVGTYTIGIVALVIRNYGILPMCAHHLKAPLFCSSTISEKNEEMQFSLIETRQLYVPNIYYRAKSLILFAIEDKNYQLEL